MSEVLSEGSTTLGAEINSATDTEIGTPVGAEEEIVELFGDIDWTTVNLGELEQQWRAELAALEEVSLLLMRLNDRKMSVH